jgi:hypothetical protein
MPIEAMPQRPGTTPGPEQQAVTAGHAPEDHNPESGGRPYLRGGRAGAGHVRHGGSGGPIPGIDPVAGTRDHVTSRRMSTAGGGGGAQAR